MLYRREGLPEEGELLLCKVTKIHYHSVFVHLEEYGLSGLIHISEIAPGRIRNIGDYVKEGKIVVCLVLNVNREKGHIDLSLRRVSEGQRRKKTDEIKQEQKAEKIVEFVAKAFKKNIKLVYDEISSHVFKEYVYLYEFFNQVAAGEAQISKFNFEKGLSVELEKQIKERIKPQIVEIMSELALSSYDMDGLEIIKNVIHKAELAGKEAVAISYKGGGVYNLLIRAEDYKHAEEILQNVIDAVEKEIEKNNILFSYKRIEK